MKILIIAFLLICSSLSYAVDFRDVEKGDTLEFNYSCKVKEQLGRLSLIMSPGTQVVVRSVMKRITSPAGFLPVIQSNIIKFHHEFTNRWGSQKKWTFEIRSESEYFYCLSKVL